MEKNKQSYNCQLITNCKRHALALLAGAAVLTGAANAAVVLDDTFGDGALGTNPGTGGGFVLQTNGLGTGASVSESDSLAKIVDGSGNNTAGIRSSNTFDLSDNSLSYTATWEVASLDFATAGNVERAIFTLQTNDSWLFAGGAEESRLIVEINAQSDEAYIRYQNRSGGSNVNYTTADFALGAFSGDADGFTATMSFDSTGISFTTIGLDATNQANISTTWAALGTFGGFATVTGDGGFHMSAFVQDLSTTGATMDLDRLSLTSIPEASSVGLIIGLVSVLAVARRRR